MVSTMQPPAVGVGHLTLSVADVAASFAFYRALGLTPFQPGEDLAILELRGGTHLLLFRRGAGAGPPDAGPARIDLMIAGRTRAELEAFREALLAAGLKPQPIPDREFYGHHLFEVADPD